MASPENITDRAKRYRAQKNVTGPKQCVMCGTKAGQIDVMHLTGNEAHGEKENLAYGCRSCNASLGAAFKKLKLGKPTNQYNPAKKGYPTLQQYMWAVSNHTRGAHDAGGAVIHATPKHKRVEYARSILHKAQETKRGRFEDRWNPAGPKYSRTIEKVNGIWTGTIYRDGAVVVSSQGGSKGQLQSWAMRYIKGLSDKDKNQNPTWDGRPISQAERDRRYAEEDADREAAEQHAELVRAHEKARLGARKNPANITLYSGNSHASAVEALKRAIAGGGYIGLKMKGSGGGWSVTADDARGQGRRNPSGITEWVADFKRQGREVGKKDSNAEFPTFRDHEEMRRQAEYMADTAIEHRGVSAGARGKLISAFTSAYSDAWRGKRRRNPGEASAEVFEDFHGFAPSEVVTVTKQLHYHSHLAAAGKLVHLDVWGVDGQGHSIKGFKGAMLAFNEDRNQLFVEGGDQAINLEDFGISQAHELETLGQLTDIGYQTNKTHLGDEGGEAVYVHKFRSTNENGKHVVVKIARYPDLIYDVRNEQLLFSGGSYEILREGINK